MPLHDLVHNMCLSCVDPCFGAFGQVTVVHKRPLVADKDIGKGTITLAELGENGPAEVKLTEAKSGSAAGILRFTISGNVNRDCKHPID